MLSSRLRRISFTRTLSCLATLIAASLLAACAPEQGAGGTGGAGSGGSAVASGGVNGGTGGVTGTGGMIGTGGVATGGSGSGGTGSGGTASGGTASGGASGGTGPATGGAGGAKPMGDAGAPATGGSGRGGGNAGAGGQPSGGAGGRAGNGGNGGAAAGPFVCNQLTGGKLTEEWFIAGFEKVVDNARWQVKWREDAYVEVWADAQSSFWTAQVDSTCVNGSSAPDRLVFGAVSFKYRTQAEWHTGVTQAVNNFKAKWPSLKRVDLVTQIRGPHNMLCPTAPTAGETIAVPPEQDAGLADVATAFPGFVFVGPKVEAHACSEFQGGGPHLTAAGNMANVSVLSDYFVAAQ